MKGAGVCLRASHYDVFLSPNRPVVPWLEVLADNYLDCSGIAWDKLVAIAKHYPVVLHCVGMGVGNAGVIDWQYCRQIKRIAKSLNAIWISDHLCWTAYEEDYTHALLPLPMTEAVADFVANKAAQLQAFFERPLLLENISSYLRAKEDTLSEVAFLNRVVNLADCSILLDINNLFVNAHNHGLICHNFLRNIDVSRVKQYHLAGYQKLKNLLIDTHDGHVAGAVWSLYRTALETVGVKPTCVEWDNHIPSWDILRTETKKVDLLMRSVKARIHACI